MPVYQYACTDCGSQLEVRQSFTDDALTVCPQCEGRLRKVLSAVGVVFKGSGFYRTDSRTSTSNGSESGAAAASGDGTKSGDKPAPAPKADSASSPAKTGSGDSSTAKASSSASG